MLLLSLGFAQGSKAKCFYLAAQITLGIGACAFPLLKAGVTCTPHSAGECLMQFALLLLQSGGDRRQVSGPLLTK